MKRTLVTLGALLLSVAAFGAKVGETTPVVQTMYGFHLIKVTDRKAAW